MRPAIRASQEVAWHLRTVGAVSELDRNLPMTQKPFVRLASPRVVDRPDLPPELAEFYARHEGVGLNSSSRRVVRLCKLTEVALVGWLDLWFGPIWGTPEGWVRFSAFRIGTGMFGEEILSVNDSPVCPNGSVLMIGSNVIGPGGDGPYVLESSLVLAARFPDWLVHLERWGWAEPGIAPVWDTTDTEQEEIRLYYLALNPTLFMDESDTTS